MNVETVFRFAASRGGRWARIGVGALLVGAGLLRRRGLLTAVGALPFGAGAADVCLLAPLFGLPLRGRALRERLGMSPDAPLLSAREREVSVQVH